MARQYRLFYRNGSFGQFATLEPAIHRTIYDRPEVNKAIEIIRENPSIEGVAVRVGLDMFNIVAFEQEAIAPKAFTF